jgi:hypothetical protein
MNLPAGWVLEPVGEYENFGFRAYDPNNPARQIFFYGNMKYFLKSNAGKDAWATYLAYGGYGDAQVFADALFSHRPRPSSFSTPSTTTLPMLRSMA